MTPPMDRDARVADWYLFVGIVRHRVWPAYRKMLKAGTPADNIEIVVRLRP